MSHTCCGTVTWNLTARGCDSKQEARGGEAVTNIHLLSNYSGSVYGVWKITTSLLVSKTSACNEAMKK